MLIHWLWYATLPGIPEKEKIELLQHFQDPEDLFFAEESTLAQIENLTEEGIQILCSRDLTKAREVLRECTDKQIEILTYADAAYPMRLKSLSDPPLVLYYKGRLPAFDTLPLIGVVGTRKASAYGLSTAKRMGFQITRCGGTVVSGAATGIDSVAMEGGLMAGGSVIGILGCGLDVIYPASNRRLFSEILRDGCLLSEFPPGTPPLKWNFPKRNRIISGISCGVLVVEAPKKSGALITAGCAREQGRDVFVIPGNVGVETCAGSNDLLRSGAIYADCGWDVMREYESLFPDRIHRDETPYQLVQLQDELEKPLIKVAQRSSFQHKKPLSAMKKEKKAIDNGAKAPYSDPEDKSISLTDQEKEILSRLSQPLLVDDLIAASGLPAGVVLATLTVLEVKGMITRLPGRRVSRKG